MRKNRKLSQLQLSKLIFCINTREHPNGQGSPLSRFLGHDVRGTLPNSLNRSFNWDKAIEMHAAMRRKKWLQKKEHDNKDTFEVGEKVLCQDQKTKLWNIPAEITGLEY